MAVFQSEERQRVKRLKSEQAINLAMQNRWQEAAEVNRQILELFPNDVDAHNRLGKALMELGRYQEAREAYERAATLDPLNTIATKNLQRLSKLVGEAAAPPPTPVDPRLFIEESGRTAVTTLVDVAPPDVVAKLTAGDQLKLELDGNEVVVRDLSGEYVGRLELKLGQRVANLIKMGNTYAAAVTAVDEQNVRVIIRETSRVPAMGTRPSFPAAVAPELVRGYVRDTLLRYEEMEEEEEYLEEAEEEVVPPLEPELGLGIEETPLVEEDLTEET